MQAFQLEMTSDSHSSSRLKQHNIKHPNGLVVTDIQTKRSSHSVLLSISCLKQHSIKHPNGVIVTAGFLNDDIQTKRSSHSVILSILVSIETLSATTTSADLLLHPSFSPLLSSTSTGPAAAAFTQIGFSAAFTSADPSPAAAIQAESRETGVLADQVVSCSPLQLHNPFTMVVLAASMVTKSGKPLVSRQFIDMTRIRIEGLLAAFPKLVGSGKQHTYVETENVRYVYQPIEGLYLLLVTNKQSNILEDLETLRILSKIVPEKSPSLDEEGICKAAFDLIFAIDEVLSLGNKENVTVAQVKQYCEMDSHEEKLHKLILQSKINETKDVMKRKATEIDKSKIEKGRSNEGGLMSLSGPSRIESSTSSSGSGFGPFGSGYGPSELGLSLDDSFSSKSKGRPPASANAPPKGLGMKLGKSQRTNQFLESLKAEGEVIVEDIQPIATQSKAPIPPTDPITVTIEERLNVTVKRDGGLSNFDVQGTLSLQILNSEGGFTQFQVEHCEIPGLSFKTHPNISKELFNNERVVGARDPNRPFPTGQNGASLMKWRIQGMQEDSLPLTVNCWPSVSGNETFVNIEYEASDMFDLRNVVISVPLPALREAPSIRQVDGEWRYDPRNSILEWSILLIDNSNRSGSMEFVIPPTDTSMFFPISIRFSAASTYSDVKVVKVNPLKGGAPPKFGQRIQLVTETYQVV